MMKHKFITLQREDHQPIYHTGLNSSFKKKIIHKIINDTDVTTNPGFADERSGNFESEFGEVDVDQVKDDKYDGIRNKDFDSMGNEVDCSFENSSKK